MAALADVMGFSNGDRGGRILSVALAGALALHGALGLALGTQRPARAAPPEPTEIELEPAPEVPKPPEPEPEPEPEPVHDPEPEPTPEPETKEPVAAPKLAPAKAAAPAAAKAGALVTATDDAKPATEEPVSFVTDPEGTTYGSGVVAKGGTADVGEKNGKPGGAPGGTGTALGPKVVAPSSGDAIVSAGDLGRAPSLHEADACKGFFPSSADDDVATVSVVVVIRANGTVASASVAAENPKGQGFGSAARSCLLSKRFEPGLDKAGKAVTSSTKVTVRFTR